jgi:hypothetical protein
MRKAVAALAFVVMLAVASHGGAAVRQDGETAKAKRSQVALRLPKAGHVSIKVIHLWVTGTAVARAPKKITLKFGGTAAGRRGRLLAASHTSRKKGRVDYTFLFVVLNPVKKTIASALDEPVEKTYISDEDYGRFVTFLFTGIDPGEVTHEHSFFYDANGTQTCIKCLHSDGAGLGNADTSGKRADLFKAVQDLDAPIDFTDGSSISKIDTGHYDDGHAFGWKKTHGKPPDWVNLTASLFDAPQADVGGIVDGIYEDAGIPLPTPPPTGTFTCVGQQIKLFDNWNGVAVVGGGTPPTFSTGGKTYCMDTIATYHWNDGKGAAPGTLSLVSSFQTLGPWQSVGTAPDGSPGNINWAASPAGVIINGSYTCRDSNPATWSKNADSGGQGFCRVWGRVAQKTG